MPLSRFFCLGGPDRDYPVHENYRYQDAKSRLLDLIEQEVDQRFARLPAEHRTADAVPLRRLQRAGLPPGELHLAQELLGKLAALDSAREAAEAEGRQAAKALRATEAAHRRAEFARAKAEALATARGEALMHAQAAHRDAEQQQLQLSEMLRSALQQLGAVLTPSKSMSQVGVASMQFGSLAEQQSQQYASPAYVRQSAAGPVQLLSPPLPGVAAPPPPHPALSPAPAGSQGGSARRSRGSGGPRRRSRPRSLDVAAGEACADLHASRGSLPASQASPHSGAPSGFTVFTNELGSPGAGAGHGDSGAAAAAHRASLSAGLSGVPWRDIGAALGASADPSGDEAAATGAAEPAEPSSAQRRAETARRVAALVLPRLDESQLGSLVRIGASLASPDFQGLGMEQVQALLPELWERAVAAVGAGAGGDVAGDRGVGAGTGEDGQPPETGTRMAPLGRRAAALPSPSPRGGVRAVFKTVDDLNFYLPFGAALGRGPAAAAGAGLPQAAGSQRPGAQSAPADELPAGAAPPPRYGLVAQNSSRGWAPQAAQHPRASAEAAPAGPTASDGLRRSEQSRGPPSLRASHDSARQAAFANRFQPMGAHAGGASLAASAAGSQAAGSQGDGPGPLVDSFEASRLAAEALVARLQAQLPPEYRDHHPGAQQAEPGAFAGAAAAPPLPAAGRAALHARRASHGGDENALGGAASKGGRPQEAWRALRESVNEPSAAHAGRRY